MLYSTMLYLYKETSKRVLRDPFGNIDSLDFCFGKPFKRVNEIDREMKRKKK